MFMLEFLLDRHDGGEMRLRNAGMKDATPGFRAVFLESSICGSFNWYCVPGIPIISLLSVAFDMVKRYFNNAETPIEGPAI